MTMQVIQHQELGSGQASITFSSIPQTYTDLVIKLCVRTNRGLANDYCGIRPNGLSTNLSGRKLFGNGASAGSDADTELYAVVTADGALANTFSNSEVYVPNYAGSTTKTFSIDSVPENNVSATFMAIHAALWNSSAAITSLTFLPIAGGTQLMTGSSITLYGVTKGSDGIVTVS
jgi:hypothetical protein